jgi:hypothetical protein
MAKPMGLDMLIAAPVEEDDEVEIGEEPAQGGDPAALLDELQATLDELRGKIGALG